MGDAPEKECAHADVDHGFGNVTAAFIIADQAAPAGHPEEGRIKLRWSTNGGRQTTLEWIEVGGPVVVEPAANQRGFGTRLLERALVTGLGTGSKVQLDFAPNGLQARIYFSGAATSPDRLAA
jgi:two-component sensor histidine kinase